MSETLDAVSLPRKARIVLRTLDAFQRPVRLHSLSLLSSGVSAGTVAVILAELQQQGMVAMVADAYLTTERGHVAARCGG